MRRYVDPTEFERQVREHFGFLVDDGFLGPDAHEHWLWYSNGRLGIQVSYDEREGSVWTTVNAQLGDRYASAGLDCLYVARGLGPAQHVRNTARSRKTLGAVLASQVAALRLVLEVLGQLDQQEFDDLLIGCHGR